MSITAAMVKELREKTGVGMMDCKAALAENNGDMDAAVDWLRTKGLAKAAKKAGRVAAEGLVGVASEGTRAAVVELNSETDFVARNDAFQALIAGTSQAALAVNGDVEALADAPFPGRDKTVGDEIKEAIATIGENMSLRRAAALSVENGAVATYVHGAIADGMGKIGVLVALESTGDAEQVTAFGRKIAMHVAATNPLSLDVASLDADVVERERQIFSEQARESGKPENIIEKMVEGRLRKFYEEVTLEKQAFVIDPDKTIEQAIEAFAKDLGSPVKLTGFVRFALGEGIEKEETDFAAEVAAAAGS
ncbi:MAG: elongation factor Ts [Rhodobacteraceae bacterium]|nr:elongation factor Ts [Paracoccaceae bacterium]